MQPIFRKGDRIERLQEWGPQPPSFTKLVHKTGTVWEDTFDPETIKWRVDGFPYGATNYHIAKLIDIRPISDSGLNCKSCNNPNPWAKPNQPDGKTYLCFECRS